MKKLHNSNPKWKRLNLLLAITSVELIVVMLFPPFKIKSNDKAYKKMKNSYLLSGKLIVFH
jgi:hypothetical protein